MRDVILNSIVNQIRYPNLITHYFIHFILLLFHEMDNETIQEHITRFDYYLN
jgi:CCR4-NOT transcription complex subunit 1